MTDQTFVSKVTFLSAVWIDSDSGNGRPAKELLLAIRDQIDHQLEHYTDA